MLIILYTILKINQAILYNLTEFKKITKSVEIKYNMIYNITNKIIMGEFVVSPILMLTADTSAVFTSTVVIAGISIVVGVLLLLIFIFNVFGKIVPIIERKSKAAEERAAARKAARKARRAAKKAAKKGETVEESSPAAEVSAPIPMPMPAPAPIVEPDISGEVVAAIAAAVAATEGSGAVVRSIKKKKVSGRNPWSAAATADNTRPF